LQALAEVLVSKTNHFSGGPKIALVRCDLLTTWVSTGNRIAIIEGIVHGNTRHLSAFST
jgi:hypothetical protein